jgi:hypothetical protein
MLWWLHGPGQWSGLSNKGIAGEEVTSFWHRKHLVEREDRSAPVDNVVIGGVLGVQVQCIGRPPPFPLGGEDVTKQHLPRSFLCSQLWGFYKPVIGTEGRAWVVGAQGRCWFCVASSCSWLR